MCVCWVNVVASCPFAGHWDQLSAVIVVVVVAAHSERSMNWIDDVVEDGNVYWMEVAIKLWWQLECNAATIFYVTRIARHAVSTMMNVKKMYVWLLAVGWVLRVASSLTGNTHTNVFAEDQKFIDAHVSLAHASCATYSFYFSVYTPKWRGQSVMELVVRHLIRFVIAAHCLCSSRQYLQSFDGLLINC